MQHFRFYCKKFIQRVLLGWKPYPKYKPKKRGWYICSIRYGNDPEQAYVMDLFWDDEVEKWKDNRRIDVYDTYKVYGYNDETGLMDKQIHQDHLCRRNDVIGFKKLPDVYDYRKVLKLHKVNAGSNDVPYTHYYCKLTDVLQSLLVEKYNVCIIDDGIYSIYLGNGRLIGHLKINDNMVIKDICIESSRLLEGGVDTLKKMFINSKIII